MYYFLNLLIKGVIIAINFLIMKPFHKISYRLPVFFQRLGYKLHSHYLRFYGFPVEKPFIPESEQIIIFLPHIGWNYLKQRPHHLARAFSEAGWTVIFLTQDIAGDKVIGMKKINENFYLCSRVRLIKHINNPWIYMNWTVNMYYLRYFKKYKLIYDHFDKLQIHTFYSKKMIREQRKALSEAKVVLASSGSLRDDIISFRKDTLLVPNAVFPEDFAIHENTAVPDDLSGILGQKKPLIGYYGIFSKWKIDYELILYCAQKLPRVNFILIGPAVSFDRSLSEYEWEKISNIYFPGEKKYQTLPSYSRHFDVAILPLIVNEVTNAISPVKLFEYFAMGLPVVSTNIAECRKYQAVNIAKDHEDFVKQIQKALPLKKDAEYQRLLQKELAVNTWGHHCKTIENKMKAF